MGYSIAMHGQIAPDSIYKAAINGNNKGKEIIVGTWTVENEGELHVTYLGAITVDSKKLHVISSSWIWGFSMRATNRMVLYNSDLKC